MFIQTESTPNPATLKFLPGQTVLGQGAMEFRSAREAEKAPLANALRAIPGVSAVMYGADFISVTKDETDWAHVKPAVLGTIMEHFTTGAPLLAKARHHQQRVVDADREAHDRDDVHREHGHVEP